jgi:hypothetical protein
MRRALKLNSDALLQKGGVADEILVNPGSHRSKPCQPYADFLTHGKAGNIISPVLGL